MALDTREPGVVLLMSFAVVFGGSAQALNCAQQNVCQPAARKQRFWVGPGAVLRPLVYRRRYRETSSKLPVFVALVVASTCLLSLRGRLGWFLLKCLEAEPPVAKTLATRSILLNSGYGHARVQTIPDQVIVASQVSYSFRHI